MGAYRAARRPTCLLADQAIGRAAENGPAEQSEDEGEERALNKADSLHGIPLNAYCSKLPAKAPPRSLELTVPQICHATRAPGLAA